MKEIKKDIVEIVKDSYLNYALSVIVSRALPDVRDGLKPVQRRILYSMYEMGLKPDARFRKSATVVGHTMAAYHPHGDAPIYEALVRMAQNFSVRYPLVLGQGNFGSVDDPSEFAAMRYTEAKLSKFGEEMLKDIEKETVDFVANYDGTRKEPQVLPSPLPNVLLNGSLGIAVGMATNILPHNLNEICDALIYLLEKETATLKEILNFVEGPDLPLGGELYFFDPKEEIYRRGQGQVVVRARAKIEGQKIIFWEVPYLVKKSELLKDLAEKIKEGKILGIKTVRDESDREGIRVVVEVQKGIDPQKLLEILYQNTDFQKSYHLNFVVLVDGIQPQLLGFLEILKLFLAHRQNVVLRRTKYELKVLKERAHILEGIKKCLGNIDRVIEIIKKSETRTVAQKNLMKVFKLDEIQANAILETKLASLAKLERKKIEQELKEKQAKIKELTEVLQNPKKVKEIIKEELKQLKERFGDQRKTKISEKTLKIQTKTPLILPQETLVLLDKNHFLKRVDIQLEKISERKSGILFEKEPILYVLPSNTQNEILLFSNLGRTFKIPVFEIPEKKGRPLSAIFELKEGEEIKEILDIKKEEKLKYFVFASQKGMVKKIDADLVLNIKRKGQLVMKLKNGDRLQSVKKLKENELIFLAANDGQVIVFRENELRKMGRQTEGVRGMKLKREATIVSQMTVPKLEGQVILGSENGFLKRTKMSEFKIQKRGGMGTRGMKISPKTGNLVFVKKLENEEYLFLFSRKKVFKIKVADIPLLKRVSQGRRLIKLEPEDKIVSGILI